MSWENNINNNEDDDTFNNNEDDDTFNINEDNYNKEEEEENYRNFYDILEKNPNSNNNLETDDEKKLKSYLNSTTVTNLFFGEKNFSLKQFEKKSEKERYQLYEEQYKKKIINSKITNKFRKIYFHPDLSIADSKKLQGPLFIDNTKYQVNSFFASSIMILFYLKRKFYHQTITSFFDKSAFSFILPNYLIVKYFKYQKLNQFRNFIDGNSEFNKYLYTNKEDDVFENEY